MSAAIQQDTSNQPVVPSYLTTGQDQLQQDLDPRAAGATTDTHGPSQAQGEIRSDERNTGSYWGGETERSECNQAAGDDDDDKGTVPAPSNIAVVTRARSRLSKPATASKFCMPSCGKFVVVWAVQFWPVGSVIRCHTLRGPLFHI